MTNNAAAIAIGKNIKTLRKGMGLTQQELADMVGLSKTYLGQIERGLVNPSVDKLHLIASAMGYYMDVSFVKAE